MVNADVKRGTHGRAFFYMPTLNGAMAIVSHAPPQKASVRVCVCEREREREGGRGEESESERERASES